MSRSPGGVETPGRRKRRKNTLLYMYKEDGCDPGEACQRPQDTLVFDRQGKSGNRHAGLGRQHAKEEILTAVPVAFGKRAALANLDLVGLRRLATEIGFILVAARLVIVPRRLEIRA